MSYAQQLHTEHMERRARFSSAVEPPEIEKSRPYSPNLKALIEPFAWASTPSATNDVTGLLVELIQSGNVVSIGQATQSAPILFPQPAWKKIAAEVVAESGVSMNDLLSCRRGRDVVPARHYLMWRLKNETTMSLPQIGRCLGGKDHTTILHGIRKHNYLVEKHAEQWADGWPVFVKAVNKDFRVRVGAKS